jgi:hypothetical protein
MANSRREELKIASGKIDFEILCAEISVTEELDLIKARDERVFGLLNDYYSEVIYPKFAFLAQTNIKTASGECLRELRRFKSAAALCARVDSFRLPAGLPVYLAQDFKVKTDYIEELAGGKGIRGPAGLAEFEGVVKALLLLYEEKRKHEASAALPEEKNKKSEAPSASPAEGKGGKKQKPAAKKTKKVRRKKSEDEEIADKDISRPEKAAAIKKVPTAPVASGSDAELTLITVFAVILGIIGAAVYSEKGNASVFGAFLGGAFGTFLASFLGNIYFMRVGYIKRDAFICLAIIIFAAASLPARPAGGRAVPVKSPYSRSKQSEKTFDYKKAKKDAMKSYNDRLNRPLIPSRVKNQKNPIRAAGQTNFSYPLLVKYLKFILKLIVFSGIIFGRE